MEQDKEFMLLIPIAIILAFTTKGTFLYLVRTTMIKVGASIEKEIQLDLTKAIILADTQEIEKKHSGKFIGHLLFDAALIIQLVSTAILNLIKDSLTLIALLGLMFYQNWRLSLLAIIMIPLATFTAKISWQKNGENNNSGSRKGWINHNLPFRNTKKFQNNLKLIKKNNLNL